MANIYSWESFIRIHGGNAGARDVFEKAMDDLLRAENSDKEVHIVKASQGDGGIDVYVHQENGIDIYQCKFFMDALNSSRWGQIKESFKKAMEPKGVKVLRWYLCMPREMQKEDIAKWDTYKKEKEKEFTGVELCCIDGSEIISRMEECDRVKNTALMDKYFHENRKKRFTNKDLIIPFTMSRANGAQGGTYVPRDDLLAKIEESFKTERIVFLSGMGGCGKSELARAYGYKHSDDYDEIFWLTCDDGDKDARVKYNFMELMSKADYKTEQSDIREFSDKVLIIVDNCNREDENFLFELECNTGNAHILISTRLSFIGDFEAIIPVESSEPEKFAYSVFIKNYCKKLRRRSAKEIKDDEIELIYKICEIVQYNTMIVSLLAIKLRDDDRLSILDCVQRIGNGVRTIKGDIKYSKDLKSHSKDMRDILSVLFSDILRHNFSENQRAVLTVLCLTPATWYGIDYICALLDGAVEGTRHKGAAEELLDFGWLQGNGDQLNIHPLIAEVIYDKPILIMEPSFFNSLLENYLGLPEDYLRKERFLIYQIIKRAYKALPEVGLAVMLLLDSMDYRGLFDRLHPEVRVSYFVSVTHDRKRYIMYCDLSDNETNTLVEVPCQEYNNNGVKLLNVYNTGEPYTLDLNVSFYGKWINSVPEGLCWDDTNIRKCIFPRTLIIIDVCAFSGCRGLSGELCLPDGLTSIGDKAFFGCSGFSGELCLPDGLTSIGDKAFFDCSGFSGDLCLPAGLASIGDSTFFGCSGFSGELCLPDGLTSIGDRAFFGCSGFTGELCLPAGLTSIGDNAFYDCSGFSGELHLPDNLRSIGDGAFSGCSGLSGELRLPENLASIDKWVFSNCRGFSGELHLPDDLRSIGDGAFRGCSGLSGELRLPENLMSIGRDVFRNCRGLSGELRLPESLTSIGNDAFRGCSSFSGELRLPESLASIGFGAFRDCSGFRGTLRLPDNIRIIGQSSFRGCSGFSGELHIPESVKRIGFGAFRDCCGFSGELHIPESVTSIGESAFYGCNKIERVIFHNRNTVINPFLIPYSDIVIVGYRHSTAESYAREYGLVFEELEEEG